MAERQIDATVLDDDIYRGHVECRRRRRRRRHNNQMSTRVR